MDKNRKIMYIKNRIIKNKKLMGCLEDGWKIQESRIQGYPQNIS